MSTKILPGGEGLLRDEIFEDLAARGGRGRTEEEVFSRWSERVHGMAVRGALDALARQGRLMKQGERWVPVDSTSLIVAELEATDAGHGIAISTERRGERYFVDRRRLDGALHGDRVLLDPDRRGGRRGRGRRGGSGKLPTASVERIVHRRHDLVVGSLARDEHDHFWLLPFDPKVPIEIEVTSETDPGREGDFAVVETVERARDAGYVEARLREHLGPLERAGVDTLVLLRHFDIPEDIPERVLEEATELPEDPSPSDIAGREDLREETVVTIDGESARDFDDAISLSRQPDGTVRLGVHIANVSHYVEEGSVLDLEAYRRSTSVYYPERAVPMLPERLSNGLCSLRPGVPRLTLSVFLDIDLSGRVRRRRFARTVIQSSRRLTYEEVRRLLEEPRAEDEERYGDVLPMLIDARALMAVLHRNRIARGSLDFDLPEGDVVLDTDGYVVGIRPEERNVAHRIIEEFMIAANEAVALELDDGDIPGLYRVHERPAVEDLEELVAILEPLGIDLQGDLSQLHPRELRDVLRQVEGKPEGPFVAAVVLRAQRRAAYSPECEGHYALASNHYLHFTSPIRRYPDLLVHRQLERHLDGADTNRDGLRSRLPYVGEHTSRCERRAERSERELLQWKKVRFLASRIGDHFKGRITGVQPFGLFVQLTDYFVDGLVHVSTLDDYYEHDAARHRLVGRRSGRSFELAQEVEVQLVDVELRHRGLDLELVEEETAAKAEPGSDRRDRSRRRGRGG